MEEKSFSPVVGLNLNYIVRVIVFVAGIFVLAMGAATVITADVGVATWDVLHIGLADISGFSVGRWVQIVGVLMVLSASAFERERPKLGSMLNIIVVGFFLNLILDSEMLPVFKGLLSRSIELVVGVTLMGTGSGMYVASKVGAGPRDGVTLLIAKRFSLSVRLSRTILEMAALAAGWSIGGPVAFGTFVSVPLVGPVMQASLKFWTGQLGKLPEPVAADRISQAAENI